ncbi:MAG: LemA family protein [Candidatus Schekmanbacteria bacterium]|nr:LemA family protein [Candidatus Schekmanbacteria bacterium]
MKKGTQIALIVVGVIALLAILIVGSFVSRYNEIVRLDEGIKQAWAQVDNQLKRRSDLIPNLVNTVKGFASHEKEVFSNIAAARAKLTGAGTIPEKIDAARSFEGALSRLLVVMENYPQLKADQSFNHLMDELAGTENRLAVERRRYNLKVEEYNSTIRIFPGRLFAAFFGFKEAVYYQVEEKDKATPEVKF